MLVALSFWILTLLCCGFAALFGGRSGRAIAFIYLLAVAATSLATLDPKAWADQHLPALAVDFALLVALLWVAMRSDRWFPLWFTGFHLVALVSHLATILAPGFAPKLYFLLQSMWSVPMLLTLAIGVALDRQARVSDERGPRSAHRRTA
ncbi:hypothetical protein CA223_04075 [Sphingomonas koreensis]|jgi:hypothetical protein|uniref:Uncharacterized protein n=2 Tax=Sphingomonas koreensis TaxID=93064 RepID=A0A1L6JB17_9SPHN|nr:hypothetical protein [Sphingomonas koreensis]APR53125.1 hypothetical protein BRX40_12420 [Sphingomonas koreensis]RSU24748.1 hypothetical protein CA224_03400 [Sphingomonas koreensis]RSU24946.1 hypothetical protein CA225_16630 [Sphingomonas koreensis]RSU26981.1 hypothetical protein CA222_08045 [Sphingomonas koreensis]RSU31485.1 hypothetical protein BRX39_18295 [Sphingomonas koreensis]